MITWMQRHKKYLVVTIWISVVAFVGAGFVGWGNVDLNISRANYVAKVGKYGVSPKELDKQFARLFNMQNQLSDGQLSREQAMKMGLDKQALIGLIQEKLLENYANDLGLRISDEMVVNAIVRDKTFADENGFNEQKYKEILQNAGIKRSEYESDIKNQLLISSLLDIFSAYKASDSDAQMLSALMGQVDRINIKIIKQEPVNASEKELQEYYDAHKEEYKSKQTYELASYTLKNQDISEDEVKAYWKENDFLYKDENGKILDYEKAKVRAHQDAVLAANKKQSNLAYIDLKSGKLNFENKKTVDESDSLLSFVQNLKENEVSKPFIYNGKWTIAKIEKINKPEILSFESARQMLIKDASEFYTKEALEKIAQQNINNLTNMQDYGWLDSKNTKFHLSDNVYAQLVSAVKTGAKRGFIINNNEAIIYEITDQKLGKIKDGVDSFKSLLENSANRLISEELLSYLGNKYKVQIYYKGNEF